jgi:hydrogenase maturation protease
MNTLVVGFGNVLLGDDGFGSEVIQRLAARALPPHVEVLDVGIGGMHFVLRLLEGFQKVVVVDAVKGGCPPGTLYLLAPDDAMLSGFDEAYADAHLTEPLRALRLGRDLGCLPDEIIIVGCEPAHCELGIGLTAAVHAAVDRAVETIQDMVGHPGDDD